MANHAAYAAFLNNDQYAIANFIRPTNQLLLSTVSPVSAELVDDVAVDMIAPLNSVTNTWISDITVTNGSDTVSTWVNIIEKEGGAILFKAFAAKDGGGFSVRLNTPIMAAAGKTIQAVCETTGAEVVVNLGGYYGAPQ